eukprot:2065701-Alexandrium_andersonii.AAC.1
MSGSHYPTWGIRVVAPAESISFAGIAQLGEHWEHCWENAHMNLRRPRTLAAELFYSLGVGLLQSAKRN